MNKNNTIMKKIITILALSFALLGIMFTSCESKTGDILEGTWKSDMGINSSTSSSEEIEMTYVFDGKGKYTFTSMQSGEVYSTIKGTYKLVEEKYLHTYCTVTNVEGVSREVEDVLELDTSSKPYTLNKTLYDVSGRVIQQLRFVKQ